MEKFHSITHTSTPLSATISSNGRSQAASTLTTPDPWESLQNSWQEQELSFTSQSKIVAS
jgi:hypothetical protein